MGCLSWGFFRKPMYSIIITLHCSVCKISARLKILGSNYLTRDHFVFQSSQWETTLQCAGHIHKMIPAQHSFIPWQWSAIKETKRLLGWILCHLIMIKKYQRYRKIITIKPLNIRHIKIPKLKCFSSHLAVVFAQTNKTRVQSRMKM